MKKQMFAMSLAVTAGLALIGTGFGAWVFSNNVTGANSAATINATAAVNVTGLMVTIEDDDNSITLDQKHEADMTISYHFDITSINSDGVDLIASNTINGGAQTASNANSYSYSESSHSFDQNSTYTITFDAVYDWKVTGGLATYIEDPAEVVLTNEVMTYAYDATNGWTLSSNALKFGTVQTQTFDWKANTSTHQANGTHTYHSANSAKPESYEEYTKMIDTLKNSNSTLVLELKDFKVGEIYKN